MFPQIAGFTEAYAIPASIKKRGPLTEMLLGTSENYLWVVLAFDKPIMYHTGKDLYAVQSLKDTTDDHGAGLERLTADFNQRLGENTKVVWVDDSVLMDLVDNEVTNLVKSLNLRAQVTPIVPSNPNLPPS